MRTVGSWLVKPVAPKVTLAVPVLRQVMGTANQLRDLDDESDYASAAAGIQQGAVLSAALSTNGGQHEHAGWPSLRP